MTKINEKAKILEDAKASFSDCATKVDTVKKAIDDAQRPFDIEIGKLEDQKRARIDPMYETLRGYSALRDTAKNFLDKAQKEYDAAVAEGIVPADWQAFNEWWGKVGKHTVGTKCGWRNKWPEQVKGPQIDGCVVWAGKADDYNEKVYCVWETSGRFVGVMVVEPAQHIGDYTSAKVVIQGTEYGEGFGHEVKKPLARFVEAVKWAVAKNAPLWRKVSKDENLPVGAIVKIQTYSGYNGHEKYEFGVVVRTNADGSVDVGQKTNIYTEMVEKYNPDYNSGTKVDTNSGTKVDTRRFEVQVNDNGIVTIDKVRGVA